ncbi:MAG: decaprenyl-phosphate phosphoribosyltransferase [Candidatus Sabulitectum sp.]|nr:decaprenyl-phosphate phosphoribosyltransferase [Candidatus Sabulitectum sp.]
MKYCYFTPMRSLKTLLEAMRIRAWTKNFFVFAALLFGKVWSLRALEETVLAALGFGLIASAIYLINDTVDREKDKLHPEKRSRPIASGRLSVKKAVISAVVLTTGTLTAAWILAPWLALVYSIYFVMQLGYSSGLKNVVILDCILIALGFVLRALAGVAVLYDSGELISLSPWLVICTFFLASLLAFAKRRHELISMGTGAKDHRTNLKDYSVSLLDQVIGISAAASILGYSIYTVSDRTAEFVSPYLWVTIPFVAYGVFRYLFIVYSLGLGGSPDRVLLRDTPLKINILLWIATVAAVLFTNPSV